MDVKLLKDQLSGIETKGKDLRVKEKLFLKASGIDEELAKTQKELIDLEGQLPDLKEKLTETVQKKNEAVQSSISAISEKMAEVLPEGMPVFKINDDGSLLIGWEYEGVFRPYEGLSGGEKVQFDLALAHALNAGILFMEGAEADDQSLVDTMGMLTQVDKQVIVCTCHPPESVPDGWACINLECV